METIEKVARAVFMVLAGALFGWVFALLALETAWRRWRAGARTGRAAVGYDSRPSLRPTREFRVRRVGTW